MKHIGAWNRIWAVLALWLYLGNAGAAPLPQLDPVPGGVTLVPLPASQAQPEAYYQRRPVMVLERDGQWQALLGIPLTTKPGTHHVRVVQTRGKVSHVPFQVEGRRYETQHITIKDKRKVSPNRDDLKRIGKERARIQTALAAFSDQRPAALQFALPVQGRESSPFGLRRFFNKQARKPHSGLDIAAPEGTPIRAPAAGRVLDRGDFFFNGNTLFLDHGNGLVTMYCHMQEIQVEAGQWLEPNEILGTVGKTGRATGPHLHWGVSLNDARVNPKLFLAAEPLDKTDTNDMVTGETGP